MAYRSSVSSETCGTISKVLYFSVKCGGRARFTCHATTPHIRPGNPSEQFPKGADRISCQFPVDPRLSVGAFLAAGGCWALVALAASAFTPAQRFLVASGSLLLAGMMI